MFVFNFTALHIVKMLGKTSKNSDNIAQS